MPFLRRVSVRPGMYLGREDVQTLYLFITAYTMARADLGVAEFGEGEETLLEEFQAWLEQRLGMTDTRGWYGLIEQHDPSDRNVGAFMRLFDEFLLSRGEGPLSG